VGELDDAADAVARLREEPGANLTVLGSGVLVRALAERGLVDEYLLLIHPLVLGTGRRLLDGVPTTPLRLDDSVTTTTGVIIATYHPAT
jgi:dihydrofolate reductase